MRRSLATGLAVGTYRAALLLYPRAQRERYGGEMVRVFEERLADAAARSRTAALLLFLRELGGAVSSGIRSRGDRGASVRMARGGPGAVEELLLDVRFALRGLRRSPSFALTAVLVLAVGIGANTAIFSAANAFFFRPLPFADAERLVMLYETNPEFGWVDQSAAPANVMDWREQVDAFEDVAAFSDLQGNVAALIGDEPTALVGMQVSGNFFSVLGVEPALGRTLRWDETWASERRAVVLGHDAWISHFGGDRSVIGRTFQLGSSSVEVVGVMPERFSFPSAGTDLWYTWGFPRESREQVSFRRAHYLRPFARLSPGVSIAEADAELQGVVRRLQVEYPETNRVMGAGLMPLRDFLVRGIRRPISVLLGAVGLLLLLACANVANLALVQGAARSREIALRHALGAGRGRVVRLLLTESVVIALLGGALGVALGWAGIRAAQALTPLGIDGATEVALDVRVVLFAVGVSVASGILFGLVPALRSTSAHVRVRLASGGKGASAGRESLRTVRALVVAEVALAVLLVGGAGLVTRSFLMIRSTDPGFRRESTLAVQLTVPSARYAAAEDVLAFQERLLEALEARPEIARAGTVEQLPLNGTSWSSQFQAAGWPPERVGLEILHRRSDRGFFEAISTPLVRGRMFDERDGSDAAPVVLINETFAREHFPGEDPLGQRIAFDRQPTAGSRWHEIIGVVQDQAQVSPAVTPRAEVFEHRLQSVGRSQWIVMRVEGAPTDAVPVVRAVLAEMDPTIPLTRATPLQEVWRSSMAKEELLLTLMGAFGGLALVLSTVGVYGVAAQAARRRTREMGIRMALGAGARDVQLLVLRQGFALAAAGVALGVVAMLAAGRALSGLLFGVAPSDPLTLAAVGGLLATTALIACWVPAWRTTRVDLVRSLTTE